MRSLTTSVKTSLLVSVDIGEDWRDVRGGVLEELGVRRANDEGMEVTWRGGVDVVG
jgi:hypothetical protein